MACRGKPLLSNFNSFLSRVLFIKTENIKEWQNFLTIKEYDFYDILFIYGLKTCISNPFG